MVGARALVDVRAHFLEFQFCSRRLRKSRSPAGATGAFGGPANPAMSTSTRVCIVGGGMAGVAAALTLVRSSADVEIVLLEGASRFGGRIRNIEMTRNLLTCAGDVDDARVHVPLGAQWIHGLYAEKVFILYALFLCIDHVSLTPRVFYPCCRIRFSLSLKN